MPEGMLVGLDAFLWGQVLAEPVTPARSLCTCPRNSDQWAGVYT